MKQILNLHRTCVSSASSWGSVFGEVSLSTATEARNGSSAHIAHPPSCRMRPSNHDRCPATLRMSTTDVIEGPGGSLPV